MPLPDSDARDVPEGASRRRIVLVVAGMLALYGVSLALLVALDQVAVVWKSLVIPTLVVAAALAGRLHAFVRDWAVFLAAIVLFDVCRGLLFGLIRFFEWPVYMGYAIAGDQLFVPGALATHSVQAWMGVGGEIGALDRLMAMAYASHFLVFLVFGMTVWLLRPDAFGRFRAGMLSVMYAGLVCYAIVPTVPPWMAFDHFAAVPPFTNVAAELFHGELPTLTAAFDLNPVAAMPSLHCAFPAFLTLFAFRYYRGGVGWAMGFYSLTVFLSTVYLGHHYLVDIVAGVLLAAAAFFAVEKFEAVRSVVRRSTAWAAGQPLRLHALTTLLLLAVMQGVSFVGQNAANASPPLPTASFVERELVGTSPLATYYQALTAYRGGDYETAHDLFGAAAEASPTEWARTNAWDYEVRSAYHAGRFPDVLRAAQRYANLSTPHAMMVAEALIRTGSRESGFALLDAVADGNPGAADIQRARAALYGEFGAAAASSLPTPVEVSLSARTGR